MTPKPLSAWAPPKHRPKSSVARVVLLQRKEAPGITLCWLDKQSLRVKIDSGIGMAG
jgi:hypothetical protein